MLFKGTLDKWNAEKAYGFIKRDDFGGRGIFVHINDFASDVEPSVGMRVEFEIEHNDRGPHAIKVKVPESAPVQFGEDMPPEAA